MENVAVHLGSSEVGLPFGRSLAFFDIDMAIGVIADLFRFAARLADKLADAGRRPAAE
jgi:hypothetical protein